MGGGATSRADGQAIDGTGTSDSYEVTGLPGWLPHRTSRQVRRKDTAPGRIGSGNRRVRPVLVGSRNHQWQQLSSTALAPMATPDPAVLAELTAQCRSSSRPQGVIFLGQAQLQDGGTPEPPPAGGISSVEALAPLVSATAGNGVVVIALDLRLLSPLPP